jgi:hypothetical protein
MENRRCSYKRLVLFISVMIILCLSFILISLYPRKNAYLDNSNKDVNTISQIGNLKSQDLTSDNVFSGIGAPWNVTHWANRTDYNQVVSFTNESYDIVEIPLGGGWEGYKLNATISDLYDTRNWINGSFNAGPDDNNESCPEDDSNFLQNWTFNYYDNPIFENNMSGNYFDNTFINTSGQDCAELRLNGFFETGFNKYNGNDTCWWNNSFMIPRGRVVYSELRFDIFASHLYNISASDFRFVIYLNDQKIYSTYTGELWNSYRGSWKHFSIPQIFWSNSSNVFSNPVNVSALEIKIALEVASLSPSILIAGAFPNSDYQQVFIDNIELITKAEAKPSLVNLKLNQTNVNDVDWTQGSVELEGNWQSNNVVANFSSPEFWGIGDYLIEFKTDINLFAIKNTPETLYETNVASLGTSFSVTNDSMVDWECYAYTSVPTGYEETKIRLEFPTDVNITWVAEPQDPTTNRLNLCDNSTQGILIIPVDTISATPDGYWKFKALSPNYCEQINIYNNVTGGWLQNNTFLSGDYINITAKINDSSLISGYIQQTEAKLTIRFPNGSIWTTQNQLKSPDVNGYVYFDPLQIHSLPPNYEVGEYEAIITWNNSYSTFGLNETGVIYKKFTVIHNSKLIPDQSYYGDIFEGEIINLKVSFNDKEDNTAIQNAQVYLDNFTVGRQYFSEISPGYYFLEFNTTGGGSGDNNLTIYANSTSYVNNKVNITIELVIQTQLTAEEFPVLQVPWNENFTVHLNYTEKLSGNGISTTLTNNWLGDNHTIEGAIGVYNLTCNSSAYEINKFHSLIINANASGYELQSIIIKIFLIERETSIEKLYLNGMNKTIEKYIEVSVNDTLNITIKYTDLITGVHVENATIQLLGENITEFLIENFTLKQYSINFNTSQLDSGFNSLNLLAQKTNYQTDTISFIVNVEKKIGEIAHESGISVININPGDSYTLQIILTEINETERIKNAIVKYYWEFGQGELTDPDNDGVYEAKLSNIPQGTFSIMITAIAGGDYQFESIEITINAQPGEEGLNLLLILLILLLIGIIIAISLIGVTRLRKSKKEIKAREAEIAYMKKQRQEITEEDITISKERRLCLVHKGPIEGYSFICPKCDTFYCPTCLDAIVKIENICWSCGKPLDPTKPSKAPFKEPEGSKEETVIAEEFKHKKVPKDKR